MSNITTVTDAEVLSELRILQDAAIMARDVVEMERLARIYTGLGYETNAAMLERRIAHERACMTQRMNNERT